MNDILNPLFAGLRRTKVEAQPQEVVSGISSRGSEPMSPISGQPMVRAMCHNVPVYVDMDNRVVIPVRENPHG